jgi:hypothetical protein
VIGYYAMQIAQTVLLIVVVFQGIDIRFANICICSEVHDCPRVPALEHAMKSLFVSQVTAFEWTPFDRPAMASFEIVERYRAMSSARQRLACMATNEAGTASYKDGSHCALRLDVERWYAS